MRSPLSFCFASVVLSLGLAGCSGSGGATGSNNPNDSTTDGGHHDDPLPSDEGAAMYIGVESDDFSAAIYAQLTNVVVTTTIDGLAPLKQSIDYAALPQAIKISTTKEKADAKIDVTLEGQIANAPGPSNGMPMTVVTRIATTHFVPGQTKLMRLHLEDRCATNAPAAFGGFPPAFGPTCAAPLTCIFGKCQDSVIAPSALEPYDSAWASHEPDLCRPSQPGAPELVVGSGQHDFTALADGATVTPMFGPQGGYMVYVALQTKSVGQYGTKTTISGAQPGSTTVVASGGAWATTYAPEDSGTCGLYGLRLVLDNGPGTMPTIADWVNKPLDITVDVVDAYGAHVTQTKRVMIAQP